MRERQHSAFGSALGKFGKVPEKQSLRSSDQELAAHNQRPGSFLARVFPKSRSQLSYDRVAHNFFAVSERKEGCILHRRSNFSRDGMIYCVDIRYPQNEKRV
jgi:hypothetical protein